MSTLIIAEAGVNHNGDLTRARELIDVAASAGADIVKFQTFAADRIATRQADKAQYQKVSTDRSESQHAMLRRLELDRNAHEHLIDHCRARGIEFLSTGFDIESVAMLVELGVGRLKIPSGEITNLPYLRYVGRQKKDVILSSGMATLGEVEAAIGALMGAGTTRDRTTVLHCSSEYPAPVEDANLRAMLTIRNAFAVAVGYSDHTEGIAVATAAVALGATVLEKHLTLDRTLPGPDHKASLEPAEFAAMVKAVRTVDRALGDGIKRPTEGERSNILVVRKSIVASTSIRAGETFTCENITAKRPGTGISPMHWDEVLGRRASRNFLPDEPIEL